MNRKYETDGYEPLKDSKAPEIIVNIVNRLGDEHSAESIALHTLAYQKLLLDRDIETSPTKLQREIAADFLKEGIVGFLYGE